MHPLCLCLVQVWNASQWVHWDHVSSEFREPDRFSGCTDYGLVGLWVLKQVSMANSGVHEYVPAAIAVCVDTCACTQLCASLPIYVCSQCVHVCERVLSGSIRSALVVRWYAPTRYCAHVTLAIVRLRRF